MSTAVLLRDIYLFNLFLNNLDGASMRNINSRNEVPVASESTAQGNEGAKTSGKRKSTKYETFPHAEERYLVNLWKENHDQLESKNARKVWNKPEVIVD